MNGSSSYLSKSGGAQDYNRMTDPNLAVSSDDDKSHLARKSQGFKLFKLLNCPFPN